MVIGKTKYQEAIEKTTESPAEEDESTLAENKLVEILNKVGRKFKDSKSSNLCVDELIFLIWEVVRAVTSKEVNQGFIQMALLSP